MIVVAEKVAAAPTICVDVRQAALMLSVSEWTIRAHIANGKLPVVKLASGDGTATNRRVLIRVADLQALADRHVDAPSGL